MPMIPQLTLAPALPVDLLSSWPPLPRSSMSACTTSERPRIELGPLRDRNESVMLTWREKGRGGLRSRKFQIAIQERYTIGDALTTHVA